MNKYYLVVLVLVGTLFNSVNAKEAEKAVKVIYKWNEDGKVRYSHMKPIGVKDYTKLDSEGLVIPDFTEGFDEIIELSVRPNNGDESNKIEKASSENNAKTGEKKTPEQKEQLKAARKQENCKIAQSNMDTLAGGEVYERDAKGNMIRMTPDAIEAKRANITKDLSYFCTDAGAVKKK